MPEKETHFYDLIVVGGGTAGILSAIAASRSGVHTAIVERNSYLGGMATGSGLSEMNAAGFQGKPVYHGIEREIFDEMIVNGDAAYHFGIPMSSNKSVVIDRLRYNPEMLKILLEQKAVESGVSIFYEMQVVAASEDENGCQIEIQGLYRTMTLKSRYLIDGTGNANLARLLGFETVRTEESQQLISTLMFRLSNLDLDELNRFIFSDRPSEVIQEGFKSGVLKGRIMAFSPIPGTRDASLNVTRSKWDYEDPEKFSQSLLEARRQIPEILAFVKAHVPGTENAYISNIAPLLGVRDAERIRGEYELTIDDLEAMREFPDTIASGCYPMDLHDPVTNTVIWKMLPGMYHIPYRSILPLNTKRTLVVGKALCADKKAFGAIRVMPIMMNVGESAGYAIALAKQKNCLVGELESAELSEFLKQKYQNA